MYRVTLMSLATLFILGCNGNSNSANTADSANVGDINNVSITNARAVDNRKVNFKLSLQSDIKTKGVPVNYYLVSEESKVISSTANEDNSTTVSTPLYQYYIGTSFLDLNRTETLTKDLNFSLSSNIPEGNYKVVAYIDPKNSKNLTLKSPIFEGKPIKIDKAKADIAILSTKLNDNILLIDDNPNNKLVINPTVSLKSYLGTVNNAYLKACLEFDDKCLDLTFNENNQTLSEYNVSVIEDPTNVSLSINIPQDIKDDLYSKLDNNIHNAKIKFTLVSSLNEPLDNNVKETNVSLYKNKIDKRLISTADGNVILRTFSKSFNTDKGYGDGSKFGIRFSSYAKAYFATLDSDAKVAGNLDVKILDYRFSMFGASVEGFVQYDSFEKTGYLAKVDLLGYTVYTKEDNVANMAEYKDVEKATLTDEEKKLPREEQEEILAKKQIKLNEEAETKSVLSYNRDFTKSLEIAKKQVIMVSIVPVTVEAGTVANLGLRANIGLEGILKLSAEMGPFANLGGFISGGVGVVGFQAGVEGSFTLVDEYFSGASDFQFVFDGDANDLRIKGILSDEIKNTFRGPSGRLDLFAEYTTPRFCQSSWTHCNSWYWDWGWHCDHYTTDYTTYPCGVTTHRPRLNIWSWYSRKYEYTLLKTSQTLSNNKIY